MQRLLPLSLLGPNLIVMNQYTKSLAPNRERSFPEVSGFLLRNLVELDSDGVVF